VRQYWVYILTNHRRVLYIGVTGNLARRVYEHRNKLVEGFTSKYNVSELVYYEPTNDIQLAIEREKQLKGWSRAKKLALVNSFNPGWRDLSDEVLESS